jgi:hypothetical protein
VPPDLLHRAGDFPENIYWAVKQKYQQSGQDRSSQISRKAGAQDPIAFDFIVELRAGPVVMVEFNNFYWRVGMGKLFR